MKTLSLALALSLLVPSAAPAAAVMKSADTFTHVTIGDPDSFDPAWSYDTASHNLISNMYEYLLTFKGSGTGIKDLQPQLATTVPTKANGLISADGLTYRFPIRKNVKFHDGSVLTPEDVRYSLLRFMLLDRNGGPSSLLLEPILGLNSTREGGKLDASAYDKAAAAVTVDKDAVVIKLKKSFAPFMTVLTGFGAIQSQKWSAANGQWDGTAATWQKYNDPKRDSIIPNDKANGTGPFKLERFDRNLKQTILVRHDGYWRGPAKLKTVVVKVIDEFATRKLMIQAGDADSVYGPQMYFPQLQNLDGVEVIDGLQNLERSAMLLFTLKMNPVANPNIGSGKLDGEGVPADFFNDKDVRIAFAHSIDFDAYIKDIIRNKGRQSTGVIPPGLVGHKGGAPKFKLDPKKAEEHFKKAWGGQLWEKGFKVSAVFNSGSAPAQTVCQMIKRNVEAINPKFKVDVRGVQWSTYLEQTQGRKIPIFLGAWQADYPDAHNFAFPLAHSAGYFPQKQGYSNPKVDALIDEAVSTLDEAKRAQLYLKLQAILDEDVPHVHIAEGVRYRTQRTWVKGFQFKPTFPDMPYGSYFYDLYKAQ